MVWPASVWNIVLGAITSAVWSVIPKSWHGWWLGSVTHGQWTTHGMRRYFLFCRGTILHNPDWPCSPGVSPLCESSMRKLEASVFPFLFLSSLGRFNSQYSSLEAALDQAG
jgi:hypothetical protein